MKVRPRLRLRTAAVVVSSGMLVAGCSGGSKPSASSSSDTSSPAPGTLGAAGDPANQSDGTASDYTPTGQLIADDGFRPNKDGFGTANYGDTLDDGSKPANLAPADLVKLFGTDVCTDPTAAACALTPEAQQWMDQTNQAMAGGHCFGFSVASLLFFTGAQNPSSFGASGTPQLPISGNQPLQEDLASAWAYQTPYLTPPSTIVTGSPNDIINALKAALVPNPTTTYTIAIFKRDGTGGHAVTPYAIEDAGGGVDKILIYDNNYPGITRFMTVDTNANTWQYNAAINPSEPSELYDGDAQTQSMSLYPTQKPGAVPCPFCAKSPASGGGDNSATPPSSSALGSSGGSVALTSASKSAPKQTSPLDNMDDIWLDGGDTEHGHLLITDAAGHKLGLVNGSLVNQIPGAIVVSPAEDEDWLVSEEPEYYVPDGTQYTITVDGTGLKNADKDEAVGVDGPYFDLEVDNINLQPGEKDTLDVGGDATHWSYQASAPQIPDVNLGISDDSADWAFEVMGDQVPANGQINFDLPDEGGTMTFGTAAGAGEGSYTLKVDEDDSQGSSHFEHSGIQLGGGDTATLDFGGWEAGGSMNLAITSNDQTQTQTLNDQDG